MGSLLDEACAILDDFENEVARIRAFYKQPAADNLNLEPVLPEDGQEEYYRMWLHGATDIWERNELERWLTDYPPHSDWVMLGVVEVAITFNERVDGSSPSSLNSYPWFESKKKRELWRTKKSTF
jgi:hypothetical protein